MINYLIWPICFISLFMSLIWIQFLYQEKEAREKRKPIAPFVSLAIPAYNEEKVLTKTVDSLANLNYPKNKFEIIIVNDGSKDNTLKEALSLQKKYNNAKINLIIIDKKNGGKASAMNCALKKARGEFFACVDSDSYVDPDALKNAITYFTEEKIGAIISVIKVFNPKNIYQKIQRVEYILCFLMRKLMGYIDTLAVTPGVLSIYRTKVIKEVGGFDEGNITEDLEIGLRVKKAGYKIKMASTSHTYTEVPVNFKELLAQRVRWFRGFILNYWSYRHMIFNKKYKLFGMFQLPLIIIAVPLLILGTSIIFMEVVKSLYEFLFRSIYINNYFLTHIINMPSLNELLLGQKFNLIIPLTLSSILGFYIFYMAHKELKENVIKSPLAILGYFIVLPYLTSYHWFSAIFKEVFRTKRKW